MKGLVYLIVLLASLNFVVAKKCARKRSKYVGTVPSPKLSTYLLNKMDTNPAEKKLSVVIQFEPPALKFVEKPKEHLHNTTLAKIKCFEHDVKALVESMRSHHDSTCNGFKATLTKLFGAAGDRNYKGYFITNSVIVNLTNDEILKLVEENSIHQIAYNKKFLNKKHTLAFNSDNNNLSGDDSKENWGKSYVGVSKNLESELNNNLESLVLGSADSGIDVDHSTIVSNYRKSAENHDYSYFDGTINLTSPINMDDPSLVSKSRCYNVTNRPCDDLGHGTHTTSIAVGKLGLASSSKFVGCKNMVLGFGSVESYLNCLQFFLAPTTAANTNPDVKLRPHVINNSYGCPLEEGCDSNAFDYAVQALKKVGVAMVVSAGNEGLEGCGSLSVQPGTSKHVLTVGATKFKQNGRAPFSSTGPKPKFKIEDKSVDLIAPGTQILGAKIKLDDDDQQLIPYDGTSMAAPHASAAYLIVMAACPHLYRQVDKIYSILKLGSQSSTNLPSCGRNLKVNHEVGNGRLDIKKSLILCKADGFVNNGEYSTLWRWIKTFNN